MKSNLKQLEKRWKELLNMAGGKPKTPEELKAYKDETLSLANKIEIELAKEYQGLIDELAIIGIKINSIWDLVNTNSKYPDAIPILLKYLPKVKHDRSKEGIVRALTVQEAKGKVGDILLKEYNKIPKTKDSLRFAFENAIKVTSKKVI